jgi:hypothetical protein
MCLDFIKTDLYEFTECEFLIDSLILEFVHNCK